MNELLAPAQTDPMDKSRLGNDLAALNGLVGFLNSPVLNTAEANLSKGETSALEAMASTTPKAEEQAAQAAANPLIQQKAPPRALPVLPVEQVPSTEVPSFNTSRIFYTGRLCSGKDYVARLTGATKEGLAVPLYYLVECFFGMILTADSPEKDTLPGVRAFLQTVGQWGRCIINAQYPLTPARALFVTAMRSLAASGALRKDLGVEWSDYGKTEDLWIDALIRRTDGKPNNVAVTGVRFKNEYTKLVKAGWTWFHVMTSAEEWKERLAKRGLQPNSPAVNDVSEKLAAALDGQVIKEISQRKNGHKLQVIWNSARPLPSNRMWSVQEFQQATGISVSGIGIEE